MDTSQWWQRPKSYGHIQPRAGRNPRHYITWEAIKKENTSKHEVCKVSVAESRMRGMKWTALENLSTIMRMVGFPSNGRKTSDKVHRNVRPGMRSEKRVDESSQRLLGRLPKGTCRTWI